MTTPSLKTIHLAFSKLSVSLAQHPRSPSSFAVPTRRPPSDPPSSGGFIHCVYVLQYIAWYLVNVIVPIWLIYQLILVLWGVSFCSGQVEGRGGALLPLPHL